MKNLIKALNGTEWNDLIFFFNKWLECRLEKRRRKFLMLVMSYRHVSHSLFDFLGAPLASGLKPLNLNL
jgi:hypothetical protein